MTLEDFMGKFVKLTTDYSAVSDLDSVVLERDTVIFIESYVPCDGSIFNADIMTIIGPELNRFKMYWSSHFEYCFEIID